MALSGYVNTATAGTGGKSYFRVDWTATQDTTNNKSTISWTLTLYCGTNKWYTNAITINYVKIDGVTVQGSKTYSNKGDGSSDWHQQLENGTITLTHNSDGTKSFKIEVSAWFYANGTKTGEGTFTLDTIPRASTLTIPTLTAGSAATLTINKASSTFKHTIQFKFYNYSSNSWVTITNKTTGTSVSWTPPVELLQQMPSNTSRTYENGLWIGTYASDDTYIAGRYYNLTINAGSSAKPTASFASTYPKPNNNTQNATVQGWGLYIKGLSKIDYSINFTGYQGSTVAAYEFVGNDQTITTQSGTTNFISSSGTLTLKARVKDSRGRWSDYVTQTITVYAYSQPTISAVAAFRCDSSGNNDFSGTYLSISCTAARGASINNNNTITILYVVKQDNTIKASGNLVSGTPTVLSDYDLTKNYTVTITVIDSVGSSLERILGIPSEVVTLYLKEGGDGASFGGYTEGSEVVDFTNWSPIGMLLGFGKAKAQIVSDSDFNNYMTPGVYGVVSGDIARTLHNCPSEYAGTLRVWGADGRVRTASDNYHRIIQQYTDILCNIYFRSIRSGATAGQYTYDSWRMVTTTIVS